LYVLGEDAHARHRIPLLRHNLERRNEDGDPDQEGSPANHSLASAPLGPMIRASVPIRESFA
jgi:hypothetical protein